MKNVIITILAILVLGLGGYLVYDKVVNNNKSEVSNNENTNEVLEDQVNNDTNNSNIISKYVGTYVGEKGKDYITIKEDGTYEFVKAYTLDGYTENRHSKGLVVSNGIYIALVEFYDTYPNEMAPLLKSYHFYINDSKLEFFGEKGITDSIYFIKK